MPAPQAVEPFRPVGSATPAVEATAGAAAGAGLGALTALRHRRAFHPDGVAVHAELEITGGTGFGSPLLDRPARLPCLVRLSRGIGLSEPRPDVLGLAIRILDAHGPGLDRDLLLVTAAGDGPGLRHVLVPARSFDHERWSSLVPYRIGGKPHLFGARPVRVAAGSASHLAELGAELASGRLRFALQVATARGGWQDVGLLEGSTSLSPEQAEALRFDPSLAAGGIEPVGLVQATRRVAYRASQAVRRRRS